MAEKDVLLHQILENAQVRLIDAGDKRCDKSWTQLDSRFPYDSIGYIREGEVSMCVNGNTCLLRPGAMYYIPAMNLFSHFVTCDFARVYWTHFVLGPKELKLSQRLSFPVGVRPSHPQEIKALFESLFAARQESFPSASLLCNGIMGQIAARFLACQADSVKLRPAERFEEMRRTAEYIRENLDKELSVERLAARVGMNPHYFIRVFQQFFQEPPIHFVLRQREEAARSLLEYSSMSIKEIGISLGFSNQNYFSAFFKKRSGYSPSEYRSLKEKTSHK